MAQYTFARLQPGYAELWARMTVIKAGAASAQARTIIAHKDRYQALEAKTGIPWGVIGCIHMRESDANFRTWLHNGDPMRNRAGMAVQTVHVPRHRPPNPNVSWEDGGYDALVTCEHYGGIHDWSPERVAYICEGFNGWGYRSPARNIPSPYLWGGTSVQKRGKFVWDGKYDAGTMDPQIGVMAVLKQLMVLDPEARFTSALPQLPAPAPTPAPAPEPDPLKPSPKAIDTESQVKPLHRSKTIWGGIVGAVTTAATAVSAFIQNIENPYALAAFLVVLVVAVIALWLVLKGRIDVNNLVKHLAIDDSEEAR